MARLRFKNTPEYQKQIQRLNRMSPDQRAILSSLLVDRSFADREMKQQLQAVEFRNRKELAGKRLALGEKRLALQKDLSQSRILSNEALASEKAQQRRNLGIAAINQKADLADRKRDFERRQNTIANYIGLGNVLAGGGLGYANMRFDLAQAKRREQQAEALNKLLKTKGYENYREL